MPNDDELSWDHTPPPVDKKTTDEEIVMDPDAIINAVENGPGQDGILEVPDLEIDTDEEAA